MKLTREQVAEKLGVDVSELTIAKNRNVNHGLKADANANGVKLGMQYISEIIAAYKRLERLADGHVMRDGKKYGVSLAENQIQWLEDKAANMHGKVFDSLRNGERAKEVCDTMPTAVE